MRSSAPVNVLVLMSAYIYGHKFILINMQRQKKQTQKINVQKSELSIISTLSARITLNILMWTLLADNFQQ